ncbi:MAG TPA: HAD-IIIA family hydrolase [Candidatus Paceibacterota bacterium]
MASSNHIVLICADRDGTINRDEDYYLGSNPHWKEQIEFLPGVIEGIRSLNAISNAKFVLVTNQSGVALAGPDFELLTEAAAREVNELIISKLKDDGCRVDGYRFCPFVSSDYARKAALKGRQVDARYINDNARCLKPNIGMLGDAAEMFGERLSEVRHKFMIGDRVTDVETGLRAGCVSFFVRSSRTNKNREAEKIVEIQDQFPDKVFVVSNLLEVAVQIKKAVDA